VSARELSTKGESGRRIERVHTIVSLDHLLTLRTVRVSCMPEV